MPQPLLCNFYAVCSKGTQIFFVLLNQTTSVSIISKILMGGIIPHVEDIYLNYGIIPYIMELFPNFYVIPPALLPPMVGLGRPRHGGRRKAKQGGITKLMLVLQCFR